MPHRQPHHPQKLKSSINISLDSLTEDGSITMTPNCRWVVALICFLTFALFLCVRPSVLDDVTTQFRGLNRFPPATTLPPLAAAPIWVVKNLHFVTEFSIGTPPQRFRGLIQHTPADFAIPSISCASESCQDYQKYNANYSSTALASNKDISIKYGSTTTNGQVSFDTFRIAGLEIPNQPFVAANKQVQDTSGLLPDHDFDTIITLSPTDETTEARLDNPFMSMISRQALNANRFSIKPPSRSGSEPGSLSFGVTRDHERLRGRLARIPLKGGDPRDIITPWQVEACAVHTAGRSTTLTNHIAVFDAGNPFMTFPRRAVAPLFHALKPIDYLGYTLAAVECDRRDNLPDLTVDLGGHNFTISAYEYTYEHEFVDEGLRCLLAIDDTEKNWFLLGASFLKRFYSVFDWDNREIGLIPLDKLEET